MCWFVLTLTLALEGVAGLGSEQDREVRLSGGEAGVVVPDQGYLTKVRELCTKHNVSASWLVHSCSQPLTGGRKGLGQL